MPKRVPAGVSPTWSLCRSDRGISRSSDVGSARELLIEVHLRRDGEDLTFVGLHVRMSRLLTTGLANQPR